MRKFFSKKAPPSESEPPSESKPPSESEHMHIVEGREVFEGDAKYNDRDYSTAVSGILPDEYDIDTVFKKEKYKDEKDAFNAFTNLNEHFKKYFYIPPYTPGVPAAKREEIKITHEDLVQYRRFVSLYNNTICVPKTLIDPRIGIDPRKPPKQLTAIQYIKELKHIYEEYQIHDKHILPKFDEIIEHLPKLKMSSEIIKELEIVTLKSGIEIIDTNSPGIKSYAISGYHFNMKLGDALEDFGEALLVIRPNIYKITSAFEKAYKLNKTSGGSKKTKKTKTTRKIRKSKKSRKTARKY